MKNKAAQQLARFRWKNTPKEVRGQFVGHNGGRPRLYPACPRYGSHRFSDEGRCPCGYRREKP